MNHVNKNVNSSVFLVRHAQSQSNHDYRVLHNITNMKVDLTEKGVVQAKEASIYLSNLIKQVGENRVVIFWNSPYTRTRRTSQIIQDNLDNKIRFFSKESIYIVERNFGMVDSLDNYENKYSEESKYYKRHRDAGDTFFCRPPLGESPFDLAMRMHQFYIQEILTKPEYIHVIVSHGASLRALNLMVNNLPYENFLSSNPNNASVNSFGENGMNELFCPSEKTF